MIEEQCDRLPILQRVRVVELSVSGHVYEMGTGDSGHTIYGIRLDETAWPKNFVATEVWHCRREDLVVI